MTQKGIVITPNSLFVDSKISYDNKLYFYKNIKKYNQVAVPSRVEKRGRYIHLYFTTPTANFTVKRKYLIKKEKWYRNAIEEEFILKFQDKKEIRQYNVEHLYAKGGE